jgi:hypothetical protein
MFNLDTLYSKRGIISDKQVAQTSALKYVAWPGRVFDVKSTVLRRVLDVSG